MQSRAMLIGILCQRDRENLLLLLRFIMDYLFQEIRDHRCHEFMPKIMFTELALSALSVSRDAIPVPTYLLSMKADFEENYAESHSLEYFEQTLGISRYRLCREFSAAFHISPLQYLQEKKIEAAKSLLLSTDDPIHEVGSMVGIDNTNHFIHLFKKHTGVTPFVYRQNAPQSIRETRCPSVPDGLPPR